MSDTLKRYLSVKQVCERLPVCKSLVYRLVREGVIPSTRLGGKILIPEEDLLTILQQPPQESPSGPAPALPPHRKIQRKRGQMDLW
jgi:excisionase family DNA binding protein